MQTKLIKLKRKLEEYGRKLRLMWLFKNDERPLFQERFKPKSTFNTRNKDAAIKRYLSRVQEKFEIPSKRLSNLTKDGHQSLYNESLFSRNFPFIKTS